MKPYRVRRHHSDQLANSLLTPQQGLLDPDIWNHLDWADIDIIPINSFREESSDHRPLTEAKLQYDGRGIYGLFKVQDCYVRCVHQQFQDMVCKDSCVEIYFQPTPDKGYISLEMSGNGTLLSYYITDAERTPGGFKAFEKLTPEQGQQIKICSSLPERVEPEISEPTEWALRFFIPFTLLEAYVGKLGKTSKPRWRCNLFKCGDETSHPHWASWQPVPKLNFHMPETFGEIEFE